MLVYNSEWSHGSKIVDLDVELPAEVIVQVSCSKPVELQGLREGSWVPLHVGPSWKVSAKLESFDALRLKGTGATGYGYRCHKMARQDGEPINHDDPPAPPLPGAGANMLLQIRHMMRQEFKRNRYPVFEPEELPFANRYVVDWDDERFEEELAQSPANPPAETSPQSRSEGAPVGAAPEAQPPSSEPVSPAQAAE